MACQPDKVVHGYAPGTTAHTYFSTGFSKTCCAFAAFDRLLILGEDLAIESALNNRQSLYWRAFEGETGLLELQNMGILTFETLQFLTRSEWVRKHV